MAVDAVHLQTPSHAMEDFETPGIERPGHEAPNRGEIATLGQQPDRGLEVPPARRGKGERACVLVDAEQQQVGFRGAARQPAAP